MADYQQPIRQEIDTSEVEYADLDLLRENLAKNKPELLREAASELLTAKRRLDNLVQVLDRHLRALDEHWTTGNDSKTVKAALRRLRGAAADVSTTISNQPPDAEQCPANPSGVAPALLLQAHTLSVFSGKNLPASADRDVSVLEGAFQGGAVGTIGGSIGGPPGMVIGAVVGTLAGGVTALFTDGPFGNLVGDSKEEKDRKAAKEHIKLLTQATHQNNQAFPAELRTDIPQFGQLDPRLPEMPRTGPGFDGTTPAGLNQSFDPGLDGLGYPTGQDGLTDPSLHRIPGVGDGGAFPGSALPGGSGPGSFPGVNADGTGGAGGAGGTDGSLPGGQGPDGANLPGVPGAPGTGPDAPATSLAGLPDPTALANPAGGNPAFGNPAHNGPAFGNPGAGNASPGNQSATGIGSPYGAAYPGGGPGSAAAGAGGRGSGNRFPMIPMIPPTGARTAAGKEEESETTRTTWLWEDDSYFTSDVPTTNAYITGESKGKA
ncbi:WXG100 family type VII secretion target [Nonomuraea candida]|uniref:WXG100 family type VII secretion target n=1 Tax=Nonomuraea candida TaxID=359159 RepID=UPI0005BB58C1|nr:hypothetical protein [Nonomuraea candida]